MWTADLKTAVTFNGEIYNHAKLRAELQALGCVFQTDHSDTEVLLHAYRSGAMLCRAAQWDVGIRHLRSSAATTFCQSRSVWKKPFYYFQEKGTFGWASELSALTQHPNCPREISRLSLMKYFAYCYVPAPRSIYERVWKLPGGWSLSFDLTTRELKAWRWWEFVIERAATPANKPDEALLGEIRATLDRAVKRRLMSDVPLGVFLSGGIDSSAVAALAAKHTAAGQLNTFSIGFTDPTFDESTYAQIVAKKIGSHHHHEKLDLDDAAKLAPQLVAQLDEPLGDGSLLPTFLLSRFTRQHVTVALGGDGGDELFAGYDPFRALQKADLYSKFIPKSIHAGIRHLAARLPVSHANISWDFKIKRTLMGLSYDPRLWNGVWMSAIEPRELNELFAEPTDPEEIYSEAIEAWDRCAQPNVVDRALQFWTNLYLQDGILAKVDRASMLCSLEARSPFLDIEFVDLARRIPWQLKLRNGNTKWILKRALEPLLPREIIDRPKKGFGMPIGRWLGEGRFDFNHAAARPYLDTGYAGRKVLAHMGNRSDERLFLWSYWVLTEWLRRPSPLN
jgi:asparagine synthase (glutamine-hydrolysing)